MSKLVLDDQQASLLAKSQGRVEICDQAGTLLGFAAPVSNEADIAEARRGLAGVGPRYTTEEVLQHLESPARK